MDDAEGHEQSGERPAIILAVHNEANLCMAVPLTTNLETSRFPFAHRINPSTNNGLTRPSVALVYQSRCITVTRLIRRMGIIDQDDLNSIFILLRDYVNFPQAI